MSVTNVAHSAGLAPSTACYHLDVLVKAGLAVRTVRGRKSVYSWSRSRWQLVCASAPTPRTSHHGDGNRLPAPEKEILTVTARPP
jgi:DNA-binding transcriptional ArsR family regulator